ncbi:MAG: beta-propeller domain-containing protein [Thiotrichales bacterium]
MSAWKQLKAAAYVGSGLIALWLAGCGDSGPAVPGDANGTDPVPRAGGTLQPATEAALLEYFRKTLGEGLRDDVRTNAFVETGVMVPMAPPSDASSSVSTGATPPAVSTTNLQEAGVDEADLIKTDGRYIYALAVAADTSGPIPLTGATPDVAMSAPASGTGSTPLHIYAAGANPSRIATLDLAGANALQPEGLYLDASRGQLVALAGSGNALWERWFYPVYWREQRTELTWIDVADPAAPVLGKRLDFDGQLVASRRIGSTLFMVLRHYPRVPGLVDFPLSSRETAQNAALLAARTAAEFLPAYRRDGAAAKPMVVPGDCYLDPANENAGADVITLVALDLASPQAEFRSRCFVGNTEALYASPNALYLAATRYRYTIDGQTAQYTSAVTTDVHKFELSALAYRGSGEVAGHLGWRQDAKSFRFSEHEGRLRVITFTGEGSAARSPVQLAVLEEDPATARLTTLATLPNATRPAAIGLTGEQLYASRFIGDKAYLVTFRVTDPFYVIDLANPADPRIAGELKVEGYSDYLHPVGDGLLLGIGKDAIADLSSPWGDGRGAWYQGVKLALIDVSDPARPIERDRLVLGGRGTESTVLFDHHGFTGLRVGERFRVALPVQLHAEAKSAAEPWASAGWTHTGLHRFEIDLGNAQIHPVGNPLVVESRAERTFGSAIGTDRSVLIDDGVYYLHAGALWAQDWAGLQLPIGPR